RAELARKVARLWEDQLHDAREAADAWRRVLRMKSGDAEAQESLERAKAAMLRTPAEPSGSRPEHAAPPPSEASSEDEADGASASDEEAAAAATGDDEQAEAPSDEPRETQLSGEAPTEEAAEAAP